MKEFVERFEDNYSGDKLKLITSHKVYHDTWYTYAIVWKDHRFRAWLTVIKEEDGKLHLQDFTPVDLTPNSIATNIERIRAIIKELNEKE